MAKGSWKIWACGFLIFFWTASGEGAPNRPPSGPVRLRISPKGTVGQVLKELSLRTAARLSLDPPTVAFLNTCPFPPHLYGASFSFKNVGEALAFLSGKGWEGSPLPIKERERAGSAYQIARCPLPVRIAGRIFWTCNNPAFAARWSKGPGDPPGGTMQVSLRGFNDGDVVKRDPIPLGPLTGAESVDYLRDRIKELTGIYFNFSPEWHQNVNYKLLPEYQSIHLPANPEIPLTLVKIQTTLKLTISGPLTLGQWLTIICAGLDEHARNRGCLWKWSSSSGDQPTYTVRCYAHPPSFEPAS